MHEGLLILGPSQNSAVDGSKEKGLLKAYKIPYQQRQCSADTDAVVGTQSCALCSGGVMHKHSVNRLKCVAPMSCDIFLVSSHLKMLETSFLECILCAVG